jgi:preprotein translocase subunit SecD
VNPARLLTFLLCCFLCCGCGSRGPQQTLHFKATPLPGANSAEIDLATAKRIVTARVKAAKIRRAFSVDTVGLNQLDVSVFAANPEDLEKIKLLVTSVGSLEFAPVAHNEVDAEIIALARDAERAVHVDGKVTAEWLPVDRGQDGAVKPEFLMQPTVVSRERNENGSSVLEWLIVYMPGMRITGDQLQIVDATFDQAGKPCVGFTLKPEGAANMFATTTELSARKATTPRRLAIIFNGTIVTAPTVQSAINLGGQITGDFTQEDVERTVMVLRSGRLPCRLTFDKLTKHTEK